MDNNEHVGRVTISEQARQSLSTDVYARHEIEACGLLLGTHDIQGNWQVEEIQPLQNIFSSPVYFEFAPEELLQAELSFAERIIGVYHSHPTGYPAASKTDRSNMLRVNQEQHIPWVWLIVCGPFHEAEIHPPLNILAYYHYEHRGLQQLPFFLIGLPSTE